MSKGIFAYCCEDDSTGNYILHDMNTTKDMFPPLLWNWMIVEVEELHM